MSVAERVSVYRDKMRARGFRPVQIWLPDTRLERVTTQIAEQGRRVAQADRRDGTLEWLDAINAEMWQDES